MRTLIKNGRVIDPASGTDAVGDVLIENGKIAAAGRTNGEADVAIDAGGLVVAPGLIDMHVHLREPGDEREETIVSGAAAAVAGGFTSVACMPNTDPPLDNEASIEFVKMRAREAGGANVFPIGAVTVGRKGEFITEMAALCRGGAVAFSDDGDCVQDAGVMRIALKYASMLGKTIISHCEDKSLAGEGVMNGGAVATSLGLPSIPREAEEIMVNRDIALARMTGARLHIAHVTTARSVELIRRAKVEGLPVTAEVCPHHLLLTDECVRTFDTNYKVNPPLRTREDIEALIEGLRDGTIDAIASDHAPHTPEEKNVEFQLAPFGVIGVETTLALMLTALADKVLPLPELIARMTINPARILGIAKGTLAVGSDADITIIDTDKEWRIDASAFVSKSRNCPFDGWQVRGKAVIVVVGGEIKHNEMPERVSG